MNSRFKPVHQFALMALVVVLVVIELVIVAFQNRAAVQVIL